MATLKKTVAVKGATAKNAVAKKTTRKLPRPRVDAGRFQAYGDDSWMDAAAKKTRADYYEEKTKEVDAEAAAALARFEAEPTARWAFHLHHEALMEPIVGNGGDAGVKGALERIGYVLRQKYIDELVPRLRAMRPIPARKIAEAVAEEKKKADEAPKPHRITRAEVDELVRKAAQKRSALEALDRKDEVKKAHETLIAKWGKFHAIKAGSSTSYYGYTNSNLNYKAGSKAQLDELKDALDAWLAASEYKPDPAAVDAAKAELADAEKAQRDLNNKYWRQETKRERAALRDRRDYADLTEDQVWALHVEVCEKDCPYTRTHKSVIPVTK